MLIFPYILPFIYLPIIIAIARMTKYIKLKNLAEDEDNIFVVAFESNSDKLIMAHHPYLVHNSKKIQIIIYCNECLEVDQNEHDNKVSDFIRRRNIIKYIVNETKEPINRKRFEIATLLRQAEEDQRIIMAQQRLSLINEIEKAKTKETKDIALDIYLKFTDNNSDVKELVAESHKNLYEKLKSLDVEESIVDDQCCCAVEGFIDNIKNKYKTYWNEPKPMRERRDKAQTLYITANPNSNSNINLYSPIIFSIIHHQHHITFTLHHDNHEYKIHRINNDINDCTMFITVVNGTVKLKYNLNDNILHIGFGDEENLIKIENKGDKLFKTSLKELMKISFIAK